MPRASHLPLPASVSRLMPARAPAILGAAAIACLAPFAVQGQVIAPQVPAQGTAAEPVVTRAEVERKGRTGFEVFLGTYLTLSKECKLGATPRIDYTTPPQNGKMTTRAFPINLRDVPGAPKRTCIGTSPNGLAVIYRSQPRFKGVETIVFNVVYPTGDIREVTARVIVQ